MAGKKPKGNTGFRNGDMFCFNCGESCSMSLPKSVDMLAIITKQFAKEHKNCKPTWKEPVNDTDGKTEEQNAAWWLKYGEHGISSIAIYQHLIIGLSIGNSKKVCETASDKTTPPRDPSDFNRCYKLIKAVPQWREKLVKMKEVSPVWAKVVDNWDKLSEMLEEQLATQKTNGMYEFMKSLGC